MRFELDAAQRQLVGLVDRVVDAARDADPREILGLLGRERLLAVHYPTRYGGRDLPLAQHIAVAERIGERGLPDVVHLVTVQGVGCPILAYGSDRQKARWLPDIAAGRVFASLLLSEHAAGSDLAGIDTTAVADAQGWRITGTKAWSLYTDWSRLALCSARTRRGRHRYDGISLFLVDLSAPGVEITPIFRAAGQPYCTVTLDAVAVGADALVGQLHNGWSLIPKVIGFERAGADYLTRASAWLEAAEATARSLPATRREAMAADLAKLNIQVETARMFAFHTANTAQELEMDEIASAYSKLICGRAAQAVARWAATEFPPPSPSEMDSQTSAVIRAAIAEAPELTISGGAQELQLDLIAGEYPIGRTVR